MASDRKNNMNFIYHFYGVILSIAAVFPQPTDSSIAAFFIK